jgi:hypothetical protein
METDKLNSKNQVIQKYLRKNSSICYYPSSGFWDTKILNLPFDVILLSDYIDCNRNRKNRVNTNQSEIEANLNILTRGMHIEIERNINKDESYIVFEIDQKIFIYYFEDNRNVRNRLIEQGIKLDAFIIHNDGCMEGGNYECVTNSEWSKEMEKVYKDNTIIVQDHNNRQYHPIEIKTYKRHDTSKNISSLFRIFSKKNL